jgi:hypothetical protein
MRKRSFLVFIELERKEDGRIKDGGSMRIDTNFGTTKIDTFDSYGRILTKRTNVRDMCERRRLFHTIRRGLLSLLKIHRCNGLGCDSWPFPSEDDCHQQVEDREISHGLDCQVDTKYHIHLTRKHLPTLVYVSWISKYLMFCTR